MHGTVKGTPMVKTSCVPTPFKGFSSSLRTEGLTKALPRDEHHLGKPQEDRYGLRDQTRPDE